MTYDSLTDFVNATIEAALWAEGLDELSPRDLHPNTVAAIVLACDAFVRRTNNIRTEASESRYATDLWLTVRGHGAGFWDGDYPEHGDELTAIASEPEIRGNLGEVYVGHDGKVYMAGKEPAIRFDA